ncbi:MAG: hypothetical protein P4L34_08865 [Paludibacter sp.]|nr:hypothetical protein [Paludibacter sp.]
MPWVCRNVFIRAVTADLKPATNDDIDFGSRYAAPLPSRPTRGLVSFPCRDARPCVSRYGSSASLDARPGVSTIMAGFSMRNMAWIWLGMMTNASQNNSDRISNDFCHFSATICPHSDKYISLSTILPNKNSRYAALMVIKYNLSLPISPSLY